MFENGFFILFLVYVCLQEKDHLVALEGKYAELSGGQSFANNPVTIKEVTTRTKR